MSGGNQFRGKPLFGIMPGFIGSDRDLHFVVLHFLCKYGPPATAQLPLGDIGAIR